MRTTKQNQNEKTYTHALCDHPCCRIFASENAGCFLRLEKPYQSDTLSMENDSVKISFRFNSLNYFCELSIENKTNEVVLVDWDKFLMVMEGESLPVLFEDTQMINKDGSKGQTPIAPETKLVRSVAPIDYIDLDMSLYNKGWIKKRGDQEIGFMIPVVLEIKQNTTIAQYPYL